MRLANVTVAELGIDEVNLSHFVPLDGRRVELRPENFATVSDFDVRAP